MVQALGMFHFNHYASYVLHGRPIDSNQKARLHAVHGLTFLRDLTNPTIVQHAPMHEYYVAHVPKGPSMLEEKLACPMEDAAHERRFLTAQRGLSASTFLEEHVSVVTRTVDMMEKMFLDSSRTAPETSQSRPTPSVNTRGCVPSPTDLQYSGGWLAVADTTQTARTFQPDLTTAIEDGATEDTDYIAIRQMLEQSRKRRRSGYQQKPGDLRVNKRVAQRALVSLRSKPSWSFHNHPQSPPGP